MTASDELLTRLSQPAACRRADACCGRWRLVLAWWLFWRGEIRDPKESYLLSYLLSYPILSYPILSYPVLSSPILSYHLLGSLFQVTFGSFKPLSKPTAHLGSGEASERQPATATSSRQQSSP